MAAAPKDELTALAPLPKRVETRAFSPKLIILKKEAVVQQDLGDEAIFSGPESEKEFCPQ